MQTSYFKPWMSLMILAGMLSVGFLGGCNQNRQKDNAIKAVRPNNKLEGRKRGNLESHQIKFLKRAMREADVLFNSFWKVQMNERAAFQTPFKTVELVLSRHFNGDQLQENFECSADSKGTQVKVNKVTKAPQIEQPDSADQFQKMGPKSNQFNPNRQQTARQQSVTYIQSLKVNRVSDCRKGQYQENVNVVWTDRSKSEISFNIAEMQNEFGATLMFIPGTKSTATCAFEQNQEGRIERMSCKGLGQTSNSETIELTDFTFDRSLTSIFVASGNRWRGQSKNDMSMEKCEEKNTPCIHVVAEKGSEIVTVYENTITESQRREKDRIEREQKQQQVQPQPNQQKTPPAGGVAPAPGDGQNTNPNPDGNQEAAPGPESDQALAAKADRAKSGQIAGQVSGQVAGQNAGQNGKKIVIPVYGNQQMHPRARGAVTPQMGGTEEAPIQHLDEYGNPVQDEGLEHPEQELTPDEQAQLLEQQQQSRQQTR